MIKLKYPPYAKQVEQRLKQGDYPKGLKLPHPLAFYTVPEIHIFDGTQKGWANAKAWNEAGYLVLVMSTDESPEKYSYKVVNNCFVFIHLSEMNEHIGILLGLIVTGGATGYQILLYQIQPGTPAEQLAEIFGVPVQKSTEVIYKTYYLRNKNNEQ